MRWAFSVPVHSFRLAVSRAQLQLFERCAVDCFWWACLIQNDAEALFFAELLFRERAPYSAMIKISFIPESWHREWTLNRYMDRLGVGFISGALPAEVFRTRHRSSCNNSFRVSHGPGEKGALAVTQARILLSLALAYSFCLKCYVSWLAELFRWCLEACLIWALYYRSTSEGGSWITRWHLVLVKWASRLLHARCVTNKQRENVKRLSANYSR